MAESNPEAGSFQLAPTEITLPPDIIEERGLNAVQIREDIATQVASVREELAEFVPLGKDEAIRVLLIDEPAPHDAFCDWDGPWASTLRFYSSRTGLLFGSDPASLSGFTVDEARGRIVLSGSALRAETLHHVDRVNAGQKGLPGEFDTPWRRELVDAARMLRPGELAGVPVEFAYTPTELERTQAIVRALNSYFGGLFRQDIFPNPTLTPFASVGHREALMVLRAAFRLAPPCGSERIYPAFVRFALDYRPSYFPLLDLAILADLQGVRDIKSATNQELNYADPMWIGEGYDLRRRLLAVSRSKVTPLLETAGVGYSDFQRILAGGVSNEITQLAAQVLAGTPGVKDLEQLVEEMAELAARLSCELKTGFADNEVVRRLKDFHEVSYGIDSQGPTGTMPAAFLDSGSIEGFNLEGARSRIDQYDIDLDRYHRHLLTLATDPEQPIIRWHIGYEEMRQQNRMRILNLQERVYDLLMKSPVAVQGQSGRQKYPSEVARLSQPEELRLKLGLEPRRPSVVSRFTSWWQN